MRKCQWCQKSIVAKNSQARFCSSQHRVYAHRAAKNPLAELRRHRRWVLWDDQKRPRTIDGHMASSTDPTTWATAKQLAGHDRIGYVLGNGIGCIDIDHCLDKGNLDYEAELFLDDYRGHYIEISPSGTGLHIWGTAAEGPGTKRRVNGVFVERYTTGRFITITGNVYQHGSLLPL